jgi:prolyl-tRNA synthetase
MPIDEYLKDALMRVSEFMLATTKELPAEATLPSHRLMLRSGMITKLASGLYTWLPLGLRVLNKVEAVVRKELAKVGAQELRMPVVQPADLWLKSGRWDKYGADMARLKDRHDRDFCLGPTHEEVITEIASNYFKSYRQLPKTFYQIQTKFRDEIRPRFGVMRAREFVMKDAYSFHLDQESLQNTYDCMYQAYQAIFESMGLAYRVVDADPGEIGGDCSHEFHVLAQSGEDLLAYSSEGDYAANVEVAKTVAQPVCDGEGVAAMQTIEAVESNVHSVFIKDQEGAWIECVLAKDDDLSDVKTGMLSQVAKPFVVITDVKGKDFEVKLKLVDAAVAAMAGFAYQDPKTQLYYQNSVVKRDWPEAVIADIRQVKEGDASPDGNGKLAFARGIEVGHIFQNGDTYTKPFNANVQSVEGKNVTILSGCYGIGISRVVAAAIEQHHDDRGIIWPEALAPFQVALVPVQAHKFTRVKALAEKLFEELKAAGIEVLYDDRKERPGVMFSDMDLIGIPHRIVISESGIDEGRVEYKSRQLKDIEHVTLDGVVDKLSGLVG